MLHRLRDIGSSFAAEPFFSSRLWKMRELNEFLSGFPKGLREGGGGGEKLLVKIFRCRAACDRRVESVASFFFIGQFFRNLAGGRG